MVIIGKECFFDLKETVLTTLKNLTADLLIFVFRSKVSVVTGVLKILLTFYQALHLMNAIHHMHRNIQVKTDLATRYL